MVWEILSNSHSLKHVVPHLDCPASAAIIWTTNNIDNYTLITSCADGELRVWNCDPEGLHFSAELNGPDAVAVLVTFPTSKNSFISFDKSGCAFEWKRKLKTNTWKGKRRYCLTDNIISDVSFSKTFSQGFVLTSKGLKVFEARTGKTNSLIENKISFESVDQIYVDEEGVYLFYVILNEEIGCLKSYCLKDKSMQILSSDIGADGVVSMSFHTKLGLLAVVSESGTIRFFKVFDSKHKSESRATKSLFYKKDISNMDSILSDLHSYICGDSDAPLNRFPVENWNPQETKVDEASSFSNEEDEERADRTFSVSSKEGNRTYSISRSSQESDS